MKSAVFVFLAIATAASNAHAMNAGQFMSKLLGGHGVAKLQDCYIAQHGDVVSGNVDTGSTDEDGVVIPADTEVTSKWNDAKHETMDISMSYARPQGREQMTIKVRVTPEGMKFIGLTTRTKSKAFFGMIPTGAENTCLEDSVNGMTIRSTNSRSFSFGGN